VAFVVNDVVHVVRRDSKDGSVLIKIGSDEMRACTEGEIRALLPVQAYSQKQLSDVSVRTDELVRFITAPVRAELGQIDRRIREKAERLRQTYTSRRRQQTLAAEVATRALEARSLQEQADSIRNSLAGLSEPDRALLDQGKAFDHADGAINEWRGTMQSLATHAGEFSRSIAVDLNQATKPPETPEPEILKAAHAEYVAVMAEAKTALDGILSRAQLARDQPETENATPWLQWQMKLAAFREAYAAAVMRSSAHKERMDQLRAIEGKLAAHQKETARLNDELKTLKAAGDAYIAERQGWHEARADRDALLDGQCQTLTASSNGAIRAHIKRHADATEFMERLREACQDQMYGASASNCSARRLSVPKILRIVGPDSSMTLRLLLHSRRNKKVLNAGLKRPL